ncbi:MAG TPA: carboxymuconolactone decarboxylase family protein [Polyangiaceae bacterium]|nr:carboxymuconolactone decarboxylase family protein [Polyangiaceae bacterium]
MTDVRIPLELAPEARDILRSLGEYTARSGLARGLLELIKLRVSTINGCAFCIDMHWRILRELGEPEPRLYGLGAWREQAGYSRRERAALAWAESVTLLPHGGVSDDVYAALRAEFTEKEIIDLTYALVTINGWNRLCVSLRIAPSQPLAEREP